MKTKIKNQKELLRKIKSIERGIQGSIDDLVFMQYIIDVLFYRTLSENFTEYVNTRQRDIGNIDFNYANLTDDNAEQMRYELSKDKGIFILPSELFENIRINANKIPNLNDTLTNIFINIEKSAQRTKHEQTIKGLFTTIDISKLLSNTPIDAVNDVLIQILDFVDSLPLYDYSNSEIDNFGDIYEILLTIYQPNAKKRNGQYYTPQIISELIARIALMGKTNVKKVYDPTCGSGSLLLKVVDILGKDNIQYGIFGQDNDIVAYNMCRLNMFLHDIDTYKLHIALGDTLTDPQFKDELPFDVIVSNPPYSIKWKGKSDPNLIKDPRFSKAGVLAPKDKADFAFIMHMLSWLSDDGRAAIICFPGVLYRGGVERKLRKYLIDNNYIDCIIQLPENLFVGTDVSTCIMVLSKSKLDTNILFVNTTRIADNRSFSQEHTEIVLNAIKDRKEIEYFTKVVSNEEIAKHDYNLSVSIYVPREEIIIPIDINAINNEVKQIVERDNILREEIDKFISEYEVDV